MGEVRELRALPLTPLRSVQLLRGPQEGVQDCGQLQAPAACDGAALTKKRHGPGRDPRRRPPAAGTPAGGPGAPGEHKLPRQESSRGGVPLPAGRGRARPPRPSPLPKAQLAPWPRRGPEDVSAGDPESAGRPQELSGEGTARPRGVRSPRPRSSAPPQPTQRLSPSRPGRTPPGRRAPCWLRGEDSSAGKGPVCARRRPGKAGRRRRPGRRAGGAGRGGAGRERGGAAALRARGSLPEISAWGTSLRLKPLAPVDLAHFPAAPTCWQGPCGRRRPARRPRTAATSLGPELHGGAGGAPGRLAQPPPAKGRAKVPAHSAGGPEAPAAWEAETTKAGGARGARGARSGRWLGRPQSAAGERAVRARPWAAGRGAGRGARGGARGRAGGARRGGAIPGARAPLRLPGPGRELPGFARSADSWRRAGWRRARGRVRGPQGGPPTPSARGGDTTCGGGGGALIAGFPAGRRHASRAPIRGLPAPRRPPPSFPRLRAGPAGLRAPAGRVPRA